MQAIRSSLYTEAVNPHAPLATTGIDWYRFLERPRLPSPSQKLLPELRHASIFVSGAGGSIGSALALRLAALRPRSLILLDASEQALYRLQTALGDLTATTKCILGNVTDAPHLAEIFDAHRPQFVFHAAAHKHVSLLEENPLEAIANNALGTLVLAECARTFSAVRLVLLSTDKAVEPVSILGASKRVAELITLAYDGVVLRLANVLGTEGSVVETFLRQIASGSAITITDLNSKRYFLTLEEAVDLMLISAIAPQPSSLLVPHLERQHSIASLADFLISNCSQEATPQRTITGLRPGDRTGEVLWASDECGTLRDEWGCFHVDHQRLDQSLLRGALKCLAESVRNRDLPRAMDAVISLVPYYKPSANITALQHSREIQSGTAPR